MPISVMEPLSLRARVLIVLLVLTVLIFVINLVRTRKLREEFALLWLLTATILVVAPLAVDWLDVLARLVGVEYSPALIFTIAFVCFLFIFFQFSITISRFSDQIKDLAQELALLAKQVEKLEAERADLGGADEA